MTEGPHIEITCQNGHQQTIRTSGMEEAQISLLAGLLDGTSPAYVYPPGPDSPIGKCGICHSQLKCVLVGHAAPVDAPPPAA